MNKEFTRMQKLAGLMTEGLYTAQMYSEEPVAETSMKVTKKQLKDKIKEMMLDEETPGEMAYAEMGSVDEAASDDIADVAPKFHIGSLVKAAEGIIAALKDGGFSEDDIYDFIVSKIKTLSVDEALFEAEKDEEADTEEVIVAKDEVPAEEAPAEDIVDTTADLDGNGTPDIDTGSPEAKKALTALMDSFNANKELGDPKLIQMSANQITYFNKNILFKAGQPQA